MKKSRLAFLFLVTLFLVPATAAQELRPAIENDRLALRFGDPKQCSSFMSYGPWDGEAEAIAVPVQHWQDGKAGEVGMLFLNRTAIVYRTLPIEHSFTILRSNFREATVSIHNAVYYLTIRSTLKKDQEFKIPCTVNPDVFSYVAMIANDFEAGTAEFKRLTRNLVPAKPTTERQINEVATENAKTPSPPMSVDADQPVTAILKAEPNGLAARDVETEIQQTDAEVEQVLERAEDYFRKGKLKLEDNKREQARDEFDKAIDAILTSGVDVRASQRLQTFYLDLVERIYREEVPVIQAPQPRNAVPVVAQSAPEPKPETAEVAKVRPPKQAEIGFRQQGLDPSPLDPLSKLSLTSDEQKVSETQLVALEQAKNALDFNFTINPLIQQYINYYQGRGRSTMEAGLRRSGRFMKIARETFRKEGVPEDITWLGQVESGWSPRARSWAAASGLWQFVGGTGAQYGLRQTAWVDDRNGVEKPTQASARYLKDLAKRYNGDWLLAMAAYNTGALNVDRAISRAGVANYWQIYPYIVQETRNYVPNILAVILIAKNPEKYGFHGIRPDAPISFDPIVVPSATSLRLIADATDTSIDYIENLNPELKRDMTPPGEIYTVRVPPGKWTQLSSVLKRVPIDRRDSARVISVSPGEGLQSVANRAGVSVATLQAMNAGVDLASTNKLVVPSSGTRLTNWRRAPSSAEASSAANLTKLRARKGDTIAKIAAARKLSADDLARLNGILPNVELQAGQEIKLPSNPSPTGSRQR